MSFNLDKKCVWCSGKIEQAEQNELHAHAYREAERERAIGDPTYSDCQDCGGKGR